VYSCAAEKPSCLFSDTCRSTVPTACHGVTHRTSVPLTTVASTTDVPKRHTGRASAANPAPVTVTVVRPPASLSAGCASAIVGTAARHDVSRRAHTREHTLARTLVRELGGAVKVDAVVRY
jgi:hypothetical protein